MLSGKLQNLKGLFPQIFHSAIYSEKQRMSTGRCAAGDSRDPRKIAWRYQEILSAKQAVVGFKTWHIESGWSNKITKMWLQQTSENKTTYRTPLKKNEGDDCLWSIKFQQKRQMQICRQTEDGTVNLYKKTPIQFFFFFPISPSCHSVNSAWAYALASKSVTPCPCHYKRQFKKKQTKTPQLLIYRST